MVGRFVTSTTAISLIADMTHKSTIGTGAAAARFEVTRGGRLSLVRYRREL
jgi:hypothetical protein